MNRDYMKRVRINRLHGFIGLLPVILCVMLLMNTNVKAASADDLYIVSIVNYKTTVMNDASAGVCISDGGTASGISFDKQKGMLTLNNYNAGPIHISRTGKGDGLIDLEVKVIGDNTIHAFENIVAGGTPPIGFSGVNVSFTGDGTLNIESKSLNNYTYSFDIKGNMIWNGPSLFMGDCGFGIEVDKAAVKEYMGDTVTGAHDEGGRITVKSGLMRIVMNSVIEKSSDANGNEVSNLYYYVPVYAGDSIDAEGGVIAVALEPNTKDYNGSTNLTPALFSAKNTITADNARIIAAIDPMFENVAVFKADTALLNDQTGSNERIRLSSNVKLTKVSSLDFSRFKVKLTEDNIVYDGSEKKPEISINGLEKDRDYTIEYRDNVNVGTASLVISGKGIFTGQTTAAFTISPMKKGSYVNVKDLQYKITKEGSTGRAGEVSVIGPLSHKLKRVTIPDKINAGGVDYKITSIGKKAFMNCVKLSKITIKTKTIKKIGKKAFAGVKSSASYKLPKSKYKKYRKLLKKAGAGASAKYRK